MANERNWLAVPAQLFLINGGTEGQVRIANAKGLKVKQKVYIYSNLIPTKVQLEIKSISNKNDLVLGPLSASMRDTTNLSAYTTATQSSIEADRQLRPDIIPDLYWRSVFEEEPTVAIRSYMVDRYGEAWDEDNPLPVEGSIVTSSDDPTKAEVQQIALPNADEEVEITLPDDTKRYLIKIQNHECQSVIAFSPGETSGNFWTISMGSIFDSSKINAPMSAKIYLAAKEPNVVAEVLSWRLI